jgi:hypothetical protein
MGEGDLKARISNGLRDRRRFLFASHGEAGPFCYGHEVFKSVLQEGRQETFSVFEYLNLAVSLDLGPYEGQRGVGCDPAPAWWCAWDVR